MQAYDTYGFYQLHRNNLYYTNLRSLAPSLPDPTKYILYFELNKIIHQNILKYIKKIQIYKIFYKIIHQNLFCGINMKK